MAVDKLASLACRFLFAMAFLLLSLSVLERVALQFGYTILGGSYGAGRLLEFAAIFLLFVIALLLRQVRDQAKKA
jgi:hypothetical protein